MPPASTAGSHPGWPSSERPQAALPCWGKGPAPRAGLGPASPHRGAAGCFTAAEHRSPPPARESPAVPPSPSRGEKRDYLLASPEVERKRKFPTFLLTFLRLCDPEVYTCILLAILGVNLKEITGWFLPSVLNQQTPPQQCSCLSPQTEQAMCLCLFIPSNMHSYGKDKRDTTVSKMEYFP